MKTIVEFLNCSKIYKGWTDKVLALENVSFKIKQGSVHGLLGPNGAGKTTLIKMMLGLQKPSSGGFRIFDKNKLGKADKQRIGFLPEESYLYDFLTIRETIEFAAKLYKNKESSLKRVDSLIEMVGLKGRSDRKIGQCSKGMARRAALAQAIVHDPEFIILDEPTSGFDPIGVSDMKRIIKVFKNQGKTVLLCSHQLADVEAVCDNITILYQGKLVVDGDVKTLLSKNSSTFLKVKGDNLDEIASSLEGKGVRCELKNEESKLENFFIESIKKWSANI